MCPHLWSEPAAAAALAAPTSHTHAQPVPMLLVRLRHALLLLDCTATHTNCRAALWGLCCAVCRWQAAAQEVRSGAGAQRLQRTRSHTAAPG